ncbi:MAG: serine hydrolase [Lachnospiraceae bacterium]|nr:serine hydrolase [Lachnospiraceae bacterium]
MSSMVGCGFSKQTGDYSLYESSEQYGIISGSSNDTKLFAEDVCVSDATDFGMDQVDSQVALGAGAFNANTKTTLYAQHLHERLYPASTTKVMTALVALKYGDLEKSYTISELACDQASDSSVAHLQPGDTYTLRQLLYGLLLVSGNDAAIAVAEAVGGSVEEFVEMMNAEAAALGATNTHFVNPHGLDDENHYTTVYDMYLMFNAAVQYTDFVDILHAVTYDCYYTNAKGESATITWTTTNRYLKNMVTSPDGFYMIGGKTGSTGAAKYCLVQYSTNSRNESIISVVFGADSPYNLYLLTSELLATFGEN